MQELPLSAVPKWHKVANQWCPQSADAMCPHCARLVNFTLVAHQFDGERATIAASARCPACGEKARFWVVDPGDASDTSQRGCKGLFVFPRSHVKRKPLLDSDALQPAALDRAYNSAIDAYNAGLWDACATSCRKTLEGIVQVKFPEAKGQLFVQLKEVFSRNEVVEPLIHLVDTLRQGGNLGAHFDLERAPDREIATLMLDLLDFILDYMFRLRARSTQLEHRLASVAVSGSEAESSSASSE